jgi:hypothetical protein
MKARDGQHGAKQKAEEKRMKQTDWERTHVFLVGVGFFVKLDGRNGFQRNAGMA